MLLKYDLSVVGAENVNRALASIERRFVEHNAKIARASGVSPGAARGARSVGGADREAAREAQRIARYYDQAHRKSVDFRIRQDERAHRARLRQIDRERAAEQRARRRFAEVTMGRAGSSVGRSLRAVGTFGTTALSLAGGFATAGAIHSQITESARAAQLANQAGRQDLKGTLLKEARATPGQTGMEALEGLGAFVDLTGDIDAARAALGPLNELALATGTNFQDMMAAGGNAFNQIKDQIQDPAERMKAFLDVMRVFAGQGQIGAVEIKDLARGMAGVAAVAPKFAESRERILAQAGAMAQAARARGGAQSAEEAVTSVQRFVTDVVQHSKRFKKQGVDIFADENETQLLDPEEIIVSSLKKTKGNLPALIKMFGIRSERVLSGFSPLFTEAGGGEAGEKAVRAEFKRLRDAALTEQKQKEGAQFRLAEPDLKFKEALKEFNATVGEELLPVLTEAIPAFRELIPHVATGARLMARFAETLMGSPLLTIGAVIAARAAASVTAGGIGDALKNAVMKSAESSNLAGSIGGALSAGFAGGITIASAIFAVQTATFERQQQDIKTGGKELQEARETKDPKRLAELREKAEERLAKEKEPGIGEFLLSKLLPYYVAPTMEEREKTAQEIANPERDSTVRSFENFADEIRKLQAALDRNTAVTEANTASGATGGAPDRTASPSPVKK